MSKAIINAHGPGSYCINCASLNTEVSALPCFSDLDSQQPLPCTLRSLSMSKQTTAQYPRLTTVGLPNFLPPRNQVLGNHTLCMIYTYTYTYTVNVCLCVCLKLAVSRGALLFTKPTQQGWWLSSLHSALLVTLCCNNLNRNLRIQDPFQCHRCSS